MDLQKKIDQFIEASCKSKTHFDILFVSDETSRLSFVRGYTALNEFKHFYGNVANVTVSAMDSAAFINETPDLSKYNVLWIDNVANRPFNEAVLSQVDKCLETLIPKWRKELDKIADVEKKQQFIDLANEYRALNLRIIYALDEFVWDAPAGRQTNVITAKTVEDAMAISDEVIVPNAELAEAIKEIGFVNEKKEVLVIPVFMSENFFPIGKIFMKSSSYATTIRTPKVLVKGTTIPKNVQNLIIHGVGKYDFTICSVGELDPRLVELVQKQTVKNLQHWANPFVSKTNAAKTASMERDAGFDFVIHTVPEDIESDVYNITNVDTDALMSIASGAVAIAGIDDANYGEGMHICGTTKMTFGSKTPVKELDALLSKWSICVNWDSVFKKQRQMLENRLVSSPSIMAGFFNAMLGRRISESRKEFFKKAEAEANADIKKES